MSGKDSPEKRCPPTRGIDARQIDRGGRDRFFPRMLFRTSGRKSMGGKRSVNRARAQIRAAQLGGVEWRMNLAS